MRTVSSAPQASLVTTTDLLKVIGVLAFLIDHYGFFIEPGDLWWRVVGRAASPIFFFFIGFAQTRNVPWSWMAFGAALTASQAWMLNFYSLNILLNFALLRLGVLPFLQNVVAAPRLWGVAAAALAFTALIPTSERFLEYGTLGWLWALFGLTRRMASDRQDLSWRLHTLGALAAAVYVRDQSIDFGFSIVQTVALVSLVVPLTVALAIFRREPLVRQPREPFARSYVSWASIPSRFTRSHSSGCRCSPIWC